MIFYGFNYQVVFFLKEDGIWVNFETDVYKLTEIDESFVTHKTLEITESPFIEILTINLDFIKE